MTDPTKRALLTLNLTAGMGPTLIRRCIESIGSADAVLEAAVSDLSMVRGIGRQKSQSLRRAMDTTLDSPALADEQQLILEHRVKLLSPEDAGYPPLLRHIPDPPPLLYVRGSLQPEDAVALAVVGTRRCTAYGREQADRLSTLCCQAGLCIVSGGARGIDAVAHQAAIRSGGRTVAVLGCGLGRPYPPEHGPLFDQIAAPHTGGGETNGHGAVISELAMTAPPLPENFPRRNRIVAGMSLGVLVIEAPSGSGALITARLAAEEQGREVMALPGRVDSRASAGCHQMVRENWATLVTNAADILDVLGETGQLLKASAHTVSAPREDQAAASPATSNLTAVQRRLFDTLDQPRSIDQVCARSGLEVGTVQANLTILEIRSLVTREQGLYRQRQGNRHVPTSL